jgi:acyl dehydratase
MSIESLAGRRYGPYSYRTSIEKVGEYVAATGADAALCTDRAPPALAGALLFVVAPHLLSDPTVQGMSVIHGEQTFAWHRPIPYEEKLSVTGDVTRVRTRGGVAYVGFDLTAEVRGVLTVSGSSLFLMSPVGTDVGGDPEPEPAAGAGSLLTPPGGAGAVAIGEEIEPLRRSVSRADLVRYAGASRDWNPIHWDHEAAVQAGLPGVVVHGLLQSAWVLQAARSAEPARAVSTARFRYRAPLGPAVPAVVTGIRTEQGAALELVTGGGTTLVAATIEM